MAACDDGAPVRHDEPLGSEDKSPNGPSREASSAGMSIRTLDVVGVVAQSAEARALGARQCGFESHRPHCHGESVFTLTDRVFSPPVPFARAAVAVRWCRLAMAACGPLPAAGARLRRHLP